MASEMAAVSLPALAVVMKTSNGCLPPFSLMVTKALPSGVLTWMVAPERRVGRGFFDSWNIGSGAGATGAGAGAATVGAAGIVAAASTFSLALAVACVSSTTFSRLP